MKMKTLSLVAALALATTAVHADTAPFYLISSSTYNPFQTPPFQPSPVPSLSYSSIKGILAHSAGTTKNQPALDIQEWENNQFFWTQKSKTVAKTVVAINVLGMDASVGNAYLAGSSPSYNVEGAPTSAEVLLKATMSHLATELGNSLGSQVKQQTFETGSFNLAFESEIKATLPQPGSVANVLNSFQKRFNEMTFDANDAVDAAFIVEVEFVAKLFDNIADFHGTSMKSTFAGLVMSGVQKIATHHGRDSDKYKAACGVIWDLMEKIVVPKSIDAFGDGATIAILFSPPTSHHSKRALVSLPILYGLGNFEQCAAKDSAGCTTITNSCNGRGACVQKKTDCWVCKCTTAVDSAFKGSTSPAHWSGNACQFKDTVAEFWLLWGTGIALLAVVFGVTMFLVSMGGSMDSGPMVAMSGGAPGIKVD